MEPFEYLSFGGGPPSLALLILNAWGEVTPKAQAVVWADTGWEKQETNRLVPQYEAWAGENGMEWINAQSKDGPLQGYVRDRSVPIPVHTEGGIGHRRCTDKWKIAPIEQELHRRYGDRPLIAQLGLHYGEVMRMRDPRVKRNRNRWPLVEKKLGRQECIEIVQMAGLEVPPWSACVGCPLQSDGRWRQVAAQWPDEFEEVAQLDDFLRVRAEATGKGPIWLHWQKRPLRQVYSGAQATFDLDHAGQVCDSGVCFT